MAIYRRTMVRSGSRLPQQEGHIRRNHQTEPEKRWSAVLLRNRMAGGRVLRQGVRGHLGACPRTHGIASVAGASDPRLAAGVSGFFLACRLPSLFESQL